MKKRNLSLNQSKAIDRLHVHDLRYFGEPLYLNLFKATNDGDLHIIVSSHALGALGASDAIVRDNVPGNAIRLVDEVEI